VIITGNATALTIIKLSTMSLLRLIGKIQISSIRFVLTKKESMLTCYLLLTWYLLFWFVFHLINII